MNGLRLVLVVLFAVFLTYANGVEKSSEEEVMKLRMVLFVPADKSFPEKYMERYKDMADYTENFFVKWMEHWGYPCEKPLKIERDKNGYPVVLALKGTKNYDEYADLKEIRKEVVTQAKSLHQIEDKNQVWWILNYPLRKRSSRGGGNAVEGGTSFANYKDGDGKINVGDEMASAFLEEILFKSLIHELTHGLGLGHIGPRNGDNLGNSLMGPVNRAYKKSNPNDNRVYLSEAGAALLWKHPLFCGENNQKPAVLPQLEVKNLNVSYDTESKQLLVTGKLQSEASAHSAVVLNASKGEKSPYWYKAFVGKVKADGSFKVHISELKEAQGELVIGFGFNNGAITGDGQKSGLNNSGIRVPYHFIENEFVFQ